MKIAFLVAGFALAMSTGLGRASAQAVGPVVEQAAEPPVAGNGASEAKRLYADGKVEYAQGRYAQALLLFERAYALSEAPGLLFNMAQAHRLAGIDHCPQAAALYKSYLAALPNAENKREVEERVLELGACERPEPATEPAAEPDLTVTPSEPTPQLHPVSEARPMATKAQTPKGALLLMGVGGALLVGGAALYAAAYAKHREAERVCPCYPGTYAKWEALSNVSYASLAAGGATLLGGVSWWMVGAPGNGRSPTQATLGVSISGRF